MLCADDRAPDMDRRPVSFAARSFLAGSKAALAWTEGEKGAKNGQSAKRRDSRALGAGSRQVPPALVGLAYLLGGLLSLPMATLGVALVLLGGDFVVTGITGYCPLYNKLGFSTALPRQHWSWHVLARNALWKAELMLKGTDILITGG